MNKMSQADFGRITAFLKMLEERKQGTVEDKADSYGGGDVFHDPVFQGLNQDVSRLEGQVRALQELLHHTTIVQPTPGKASLGDIITIRFGGGIVDRLLLTGVAIGESNVQMLSARAPIGAALLGKRVGDIAIANVNGKNVIANLLKIERA